MVCTGKALRPKDGALQDLAKLNVCSKKWAGTIKTGSAGPIHAVVPFCYLHAVHHSAKIKNTVQRIYLKVKFQQVLFALCLAWCGGGAERKSVGYRLASIPVPAVPPILCGMT
jgi:hypothetical protein